MLRRCIWFLTRNTQKTHCSTLKFGSCWGAPHVLYLRQNGWILDAEDVARHCDIFGCRLIKAFNRFACRKFIQNAKNQSIEAGILPSRPKQFPPHHPDFYAKYNQKYFDVTKPLEYIWKMHFTQCLRLPSCRSTVT